MLSAVRRDFFVQAAFECARGFVAAAMTPLTVFARMILAAGVVPTFVVLVAVLVWLMVLVVVATVFAVVAVQLKFPRMNRTAIFWPF